MTIKEFLGDCATSDMCKLNITFIELTEEYCKSVAFNKYAVKLQTVAKCKLGKKHYDEVYGFFARIFLKENQYNWIIAKARREFMLVQVFCNIIANDIITDKLPPAYRPKDVNDVNDVKGAKDVFALFADNYKKIRTDIYLTSNTFLNENKDNNILILDDILIHGRALTQLVQYLEQFYCINNQADAATGEKKIQVKTVVVHKDAECLPELCAVLCNDKYKDIASWRKYGESDTDWKQKSNAYVNLILYAGQSYAAFVDSYQVTDNLYEMLKLNGYTQTITGINSTKQDTCGVNMSVVFEESVKTPNVNLNQIVHCVRNYKTYTTDSTPVTAVPFVVPFVTLPFVKLDADLTNALQAWYAGLFVKDDKKELNKLNVVKTVGTIGNKDVFAYKLLTNIYSNVLAKKIGLLTPTSNTLKYSFGVEWSKVTATVSQLCTIYDKLNANGNAVTLVVGEHIKNAIPAVAIWQKVLDEVQLDRYVVEDFYYLVRKFITALHAENEKRAAMQEERLQGLPLYLFYSVLSAWLKTKNMELTERLYQEIYAYLISLWDVGIANYNVDVYSIDGIQYVGGCIVDGEQAFFAMLEQNYKTAADVVSCINALHNYSGNIYSATIRNLTNIQAKLYGLTTDKQKLDYVIEYFKAHKTVDELMPAGLYTVETARKWYSIISNELQQI